MATFAPPPAPAALLASPPPLSFRGRIFRPAHGYAPRTLVELHIRAGVGAILNKREWWAKWRRDDGAIRDKWFDEFERELIVKTFEWTAREWTAWGLEEAVLFKFDKFPAECSDTEMHAFLETVCATIPYNLIWHEDWWEEYGQEEEDDGGEEEVVNENSGEENEDDGEEGQEYGGEDQHGVGEEEEKDGDFGLGETSEQFKQGNERMESYGQIVWYFELVLLNKRVLETPLDPWRAPSEFGLGTDEAVDKATQLILAVHRGEVTKENFATFVPFGDLRPAIVDALWVHVDHIMLELVEIRQCMSKTLEVLIENNQLDADVVTEFVSSGPVQETWMSDLLIKDSVKRKFASEVAVLENVPEAEKDWHPGSNNQVLDLVHPSLFCCVFGLTKVVASQVEAANTVDDIVKRLQQIAFDASQIAENKYRGAAEFQWIPSEFLVDATGEVKILSYINNLHPVKHRAIRAIAHDGFPRRNERETHEVPRHPTIPAVLDLSPPATPFTLRDKKIQVIVKIAEIVLTPDNPSYPGGAWHVEGSDAEQIVATGIYYFGCDNITESKLSFRVIVNEPYYQQDDTVGMAAAYGLVRDERLVQTLGAVTAIEDRCVVFPNTLQHRVEPFELADATKPGVRKILAFFIVDPSKQIPSTAVIPPQQAEWIRDGQEPLLSQLQTLRSLPDGVVDMNVREYLGSGVTLEDAKAYRVKLMEERKASLDDDEDHELFFSLCEH